MQRKSEIQKRWRELQERIKTAARKSGRTGDDIVPIAVTKTFPPSDIRLLQELGFDQFGENRVAELQSKVAASYEGPLTWHMLGQLQTNKVNHAVRASTFIHSCDRPRLVHALERAAANQGKRVGVLLQLRLDEDPARGGVDPSEMLGLAEVVANAQNLDLKGVMAMAPREGDPARAFARVRELSETLIADHPQATWISGGMSNDFEIAISHGATHIRLGRGLLGRRPSVG